MRTYEIRERIYMQNIVTSMNNWYMECTHIQAHTRYTNPLENVTDSDMLRVANQSTCVTQIRNLQKRKKWLCIRFVAKFFIFFSILAWGRCPQNWVLENDRATIGQQQSGTIGQAPRTAAIERPFGETQSGAIWASMQSSNRVTSAIDPIGRPCRSARIVERIRSGANWQLPQSRPIGQQAH